MRGWLSIVGALMLAVMLWTGSMAHAADASGCVDVTADAIDSDGGKRDQTPAIPDNALCHHHGGCHSHHVAIPSDGTSDLSRDPQTRPVGEARDSRVDGGEPGTALRPPIA